MCSSDFKTTGKERHKEQWTYVVSAQQAAVLLRILLKTFSSELRPQSMNSRAVAEEILCAAIRSS